jgi:putative membrane protein
MRLVGCRHRRGLPVNLYRRAALGRRRTPLCAMSDPRVFFAAERTLLAWIRTGLTIMGFGFVVARFGLFLNLLAAQHALPDYRGDATPHVSAIVGIALVVLGALAILFAAFQHRTYISSLPVVDIPKSHSRTFPLVAALLLGVLGLALAVYLAV